MEIISKNKNAFLLMMVLCNASLLRAMESQKMVVRIEVQPSQQYLDLLQQLVVRLSEDQKAVSSTGDFPKIRSHFVNESFHLNRTQIQQPDTKNELLQSQDFETMWIKSFAQLIMAQLPSFEDPNDFEVLISRGRELLEQDKVAVVLDGNSSKLPLPEVSRIWPQVIVQAIYEKCRIANYTKLIIASELSGSGKLENLIVQYIQSDEGKKELNVKVNDLTPLISAAVRGSLSTARLLLEAGANPNVSNSSGNMPVMFAACENRVDMIELLHGYHAYINIRNNDGYTPIHLAVSNDRKDATDYLLEKKAQLGIRTSSGRAPLDTAIVRSNLELVGFLLSRGAKINIDGNNSELKLALRELSKVRCWEDKNLDREKQMAAIIFLLLRDNQTTISEDIIKSVKKLDLNYVASQMQSNTLVK